MLNTSIVKLAPAYKRINNTKKNTFHTERCFARFLDQEVSFDDITYLIPIVFLQKHL